MADDGTQLGDLKAVIERSDGVMLDVRSSVEKMSDSVEKMTEKFDKLSDKLDLVLDALLGKTQTEGNNNKDPKYIGDIDDSNPNREVPIAEEAKMAQDNYRPFDVEDVVDTLVDPNPR